MIDLAIVASTSIFNTLLGVTVYLRNPRAKLNQLFALFSIAVVTWTFSNYLADNAPDYNLLFTRLTFLFGALTALSMYWISSYFPSGKVLDSVKTRRVQVVSVCIAGILSVSPWVVNSVTKTDEGVNLKLGTLYFVYILYILLALYMIIFNFVRHFKREDSKARTQIKYLISYYRF
jgi:hypothetical protein